MVDREMVTVDGTRHVPRGKDAGSANMRAYWRDRGRGIAVRDACKPPWVDFPIHHLSVPPA